MLRPLPAALVALSLLAAPLAAQLHPWTQPGFDCGRVPPETALGLITVFLKKTPAQQAELERLLVEQQNPSSPNYRRWLTPEQYAARFGASAGDANAVANWLRAQGLAVERIARGRNWVSFSGSAAQVERALHTELHRYFAGGAMHVAPFLAPSVPEALAPAIGGIAGLDDYDADARAAPLDTLPDKSHGVAPDDFAIIYNAAPLYSAGITGAGQKIAIAGRSDVNLSDIRLYRSSFGLAPNDPQFVAYGPDPGINKSQGENTGDIEAVMAVARDATVILVVTNNVFASVAHAVDDRLAPVISFSYAACEQAVAATVGQYQATEVQSLAQQANAEGITWVVASGDYGAASCDVTPTAVLGFSTDFPASVPEITAVGGTQFAEGDGSYWNAANTATGASVRSYIPEMAWNETTGNAAKAATGGGASVLFSKPAWQSAPGVPQDGARDVPDLSFNAAVAHDPDLGILNGTIGSNSGTSVAAPSFAGVLALLNQYLMSNGMVQQPGLGNVNPTLYRLARNAPSVFHDVMAGSSNRFCQIGTPDCTSGLLGYPAVPGYDLATGLGSLDIFHFVTEWSQARAPSATTVATGAAALALSGSMQLTATVTSGAGVAPTGTVTVNAGAQLLGTIPLQASGSTATATLTIYGSQLAPGAETLTAVYSGDANLDGSSGSVAVNVTVPTNNSAVFPSIAPNPVYQHTQPDSQGNTLFFTISLTEAAGIGTTLTAFTIDGASQPLAIFPTTAIPPHGTVSVAISTSAPAVPSTRVYGLSGVDAGGFQWHQEVTANFLAPQFVVITGIANAASGDASALAPGAIASVYGGNLSPFTLQASTVPLPLSLGGVSATVNGIPAPLFFVSPGQVNLQLPYELQPGAATIAIVNNGQAGVASPLESFHAVATGPGIFVDGSGNLVPFASGARGQTLTLFLTGFGAVAPAVATGAAPAPGTPVSQLPAPAHSLTLTIGGKPAAVTFAGIPSGLVGVMQVNFQVPDDAPPGPQPVVATVGGVASTGAATFTVSQ